jgi:glycosyltransferase involved in cell wall biosynthesis
MLRTLRTNYGFQRAGVVIANGRSARDYLPARKEPLILAAGRLWDEGKNLAALEAVAPGLPWPIRVAGSATQPDGGTRIPRGVEAAGDLAPRALARELARASIYALPARYEPFGLSVLEAALSGCALVLGDIPTLREIWGPSAIYVAPDDHEALAAALKRLIEDASTRQSLAHAARARAIKLTPERMANAYLDAYEIMENRRVEPPLRVQPVPPGATACAS